MTPMSRIWWEMFPQAVDVKLKRTGSCFCALKCLVIYNNSQLLLDPYGLLQCAWAELEGIKRISDSLEMPCTAWTFCDQNNSEFHRKQVKALFVSLLSGNDTGEQIDGSSSPTLQFIRFVSNTDSNNKLNLVFKYCK